MSINSTLLVDPEDEHFLTQYSWQLSNRGYAQAGTQRGEYRVSFTLHRLITNAPADMQVDHVNGNPLDNRKANLRIVTPSENSQNRKGACRNSKTGVRGVYLIPSSGRYCAQVRVHGKKIYLGTFATLDEAAKAAREGRKQYMTHSSRD